VTNLGLSRPSVFSSALLGLLTTSCGTGLAQTPSSSTPPTLESWRHAKQMLAEIGERTSRPRTMRIALALREPMTGRTLESRGALAVSPPEALRMILLGPGGTTSLDLWLRADAFRFAVPAIDLLRRGDAQTPRADKRGLPVDFLRWWLLRPTSGTLLWHVLRDNETRFVLRDGQAIVDLHVARSGRIMARRTTWEPSSDQPNERRKIDEETVDADRWGCGVVQYRQASTNLRVTVTCESEDAERAPNPRAFVDPDAPDSSLFLRWRSGS
jgi:hypothetical protein